MLLLFIRIIDSIQESCHCNDTMVCVSSVACVNDMLGSLEQISRGVGITDAISQSVNQLCNLLDSGNCTFFFFIFSEPTKPFVSKLVRNVPWKVVYRMYFLCCLEIQDGHHCRTHGKLSKTPFSQKQQT